MNYPNFAPLLFFLLTITESQWCRINIVDIADDDGDKIDDDDDDDDDADDDDDNEDDDDDDADDDPADGDNTLGQVGPAAAGGGATFHQDWKHTLWWKWWCWWSVFRMFSYCCCNFSSRLKADICLILLWCYDDDVCLSVYLCESHPWLRKFKQARKLQATLEVCNPKLSLTDLLTHRGEV